MGFYGRRFRLSNYVVVKCVHAFCLRIGFKGISEGSFGNGTLNVASSICYGVKIDEMIIFVLNCLRRDQEINRTFQGSRD